MSRLIYRKPASCWEEALPIGNGYLGGMIYGEKTSEHIQLNEDSVWYGGPIDRNNPDAHSNLEKVRKLILEGETKEAERLLRFAFSGTPQSERPYQSLGDVYFDFMDSMGEPKQYERELDLTKAIHKVTTISDGMTYERETFASYPQHCIIIHFSSTQNKRISVAANISRKAFYDYATHSEDTVYLSAKLGGDGVTVCMGVSAICEDGRIEAVGEHLVVSDATKITFLITAATTYRYENPTIQVNEMLASAKKLTYLDLKQRHVEDYQKLFGRVRLTLPYDETLDTLDTDERLQRIDENHMDGGLISTYFDYGRYLLISCSRPGTLPANLQGIWNQDMDPAWGSKYTININMEMNYWPALKCNLSECELPLFDHLEKMKVNGEKTAKKMYGCRGFVAHHNTDLWADTAPQDIYTPATYWVMGGAWLSTYIWEYYSYTLDIDFLKQMYPVLKSAVLFFHDFLIKQGEYYVTCPSVSPENTYWNKDGEPACVCVGSSMDLEILMDLLTDYRKAAELVEDTDGQFIKRTEEILQHLPKLQIGSQGQIMEWQEDYEEVEPGHRHISQLYALHPSMQITPDLTPELAQAARITLERRLQYGGGHTGWSRAWIMNMYARLWDGDQVYEHLLLLFAKSTLPNLFDHHPPFQIDGNFGAINAIVEMLVQSDEERILLLPALPSELTEGSINGILLKGGAKLDLEWKQGKVWKARVKADKALHTEIIYDGKSKYVQLSSGQELMVTIQDFR